MQKNAVKKAKKGAENRNFSAFSDRTVETMKDKQEININTHIY